VNAASVLRALRRLPPLETLVLVLAFGLLVAVTIATQRAKSTLLPDSYSTYDATSGGYRALYELLVREGVRAGRFEQRPAFLTAQTDTLVWAEPLPFDSRQLATTNADVAALQEWVRAGGSLLYIGFDDVAAKRGILGLPRSGIAAGKRGAPFLAAALARAGARRIEVRAARRYRVERRGTRVLLDDGRGAVAVTYAFGRGRVTALIDESLFTNASLARGDGARLAVALATPRRAAGSVDFDEAVHGHDIPERWWQVVPLPFAIALGVAGMAVLIAFAGAAMRLGPPLLPETHENRTTGDFIEALGSLFARGKAIRYVLESAERSTARAVARALRLPEGATVDQIAARIDDDASRADFRELVRIAGNGFADDKNLVRGVALAQRLRKEYSAHARPRY
jgi:hypothetical protein